MGIREIAKKAKVSIATVSRVLNTPHLVTERTRKKVLKTLEEFKYKKYESSHIEEGKISRIGVILPDIKNVLFARILEGITTQAYEYGLYLDLHFTHDDIESEAIAVNKLIKKNTLGVILIRAMNQVSESSKLIEKLNKYKIPCVLIDRDVPLNNVSGVFMSNANAVYDSINFLISNDYKKIAFISGPSNNLNTIQRLDGYKKAYEGHNLDLNNEFIYTSEFTVDSGFKITNQILNKKNIPDAIFCCSNQITIGCINAIDKKGLIIGEDIKLFSFVKINKEEYVNNFTISYIDHKTEQLGVRSVIILKNKLAGVKELIREVLDYKVCY